MSNQKPTSKKTVSISKKAQELIEKLRDTGSPFEPAWWLTSPHLQTAWPHYFRKHRKLKERPERFELMDGDFIDAQWVGNDTGPIVVVLHGLEGSIKSIYANAILHAISQQGWRGLFLHFRNCSPNVNRADFTNHIGDTLDITNILSIIRHREPSVPIACVGFSFGANVLLKLLGQMGSRCKINAGICISPPFKLDVCSHYGESNNMCYLYERQLVHYMKRSIYRKFKNHKSPPVDLVKMSKCHSFRDFDTVVTAPLHGFSDIDSYYQDASSYYYLDGVKTPSLVIHALDDPLIPLVATPKISEFSPYTIAEYYSHGGHLGFVSGSHLGIAEYWLEDRVIAFLKVAFGN
ncbi:MAG: alpha/beta fold hydrolase [Pseudomonadota bacterium]|nr:alpha/beta fold hydrolase [Pseudomonadota bacterium]